MEASVDAASATLRIDGETLEAFSIRVAPSDAESPRILRWLETWSGADR
jgi:hypothetical protein